MNGTDGDVPELTQEESERVAGIPGVKDLESGKPGVAPIDLEHEAVEQAIGKPLQRERPGQ